VRGKWAAGIPPRNFVWVIKDRLAISERPGGYARTHRKVRRKEEILWLREQGFTRIVSLLPSTHNLYAYDELDIGWTHIPFAPTDDARAFLVELYGRLKEWLAAGERVLVHQEELGDRVIGTVAGYLLGTGLLESGPQAIAALERMTARQLGPAGRELVALASALEL